MTPRIRALCVAASSAILAVSVSACGSSSAPTRPAEKPNVFATPSVGVTGTPAPGAKVLTVKLTKTSVEPTGARVKLTANQPLVFKIDAAQAGMLHVHSTPEQKIGFPKGASEITIQIKQPGIVDVEDHDLDKLIFQLEVR